MCLPQETTTTDQFEPQSSPPQPSSNPTNSENVCLPQTSAAAYSEEHDEFSPPPPKKLRLSMRKRDLPEHPVLPGCTVSCNRQCKDINEEQRVSINKQYWNMTHNERAQWRYDILKIVDCQRPIIGESRRMNTVQYFLPSKENDTIPVCKTFFLTTLGYQSNNDQAIKQTLSVEPGVLSVPKDGRGRHSSHRKVDTTLIKKHIESFNPAIPHYRREHAPYRRYLPSDLNISKMHKDYLEKHETEQVGRETYRKVVKQSNISFTPLGNEECEFCTSSLLHRKELKHDDEIEDCETCAQYRQHKREYSRAREEYSHDKTKSQNSDEVIVSADLMKVTVIPELPHKVCIFTPREIVFTETFSPIGKGKRSNHLAIVWDEATSGRDAEEVTSCFWHFILNEKDAKSIIIYVDNCAAQNKNWLLFSSLLRIVNSEEVACDSITLKYLVAGHTFMSADADHAAIEKSLKKKKIIYDLDAFCGCVSDTGISLKRLEFSDFRKWTDDISRYQLQKLGDNRPYLKDICVFMVLRGSSDFHFKRTFDDSEFQTVNLLKSSVDQSLPPMKTKPRGISKSKKVKLNSSLLSLIPSSRRDYWNNLPESDSRDLLQSRDKTQICVY